MCRQVLETHLSQLHWQMNDIICDQIRNKKKLLKGVLNDNTFGPNAIDINKCKNETDFYLTYC